MATTTAAPPKISTLNLSLPNGRQISFSYPQSPLMDAVCQNILARGEYPLLPFLDAHTIIDVGANVGATTIIFSAQYSGATIYALEPSQQAFAFLQSNTAALPNVRRFNIGAFDHDKTATLHLGKEASVTNSLIANVMTDGATESIQLRKLSGFLAEQRIDHVSLLKLDTEGAELPILKDLMPMLPKIDAIFVEYHSESDRLELDRMLTPTYTLYAFRAEHPHRGLMCFVSKPILESRSEWNVMQIAPPQT